MRRLAALDVSEAAALSPATLRALLRLCAAPRGALRRLGMAGCLTLPGGDEAAAKAAGTEAAAQALGGLDLSSCHPALLPLLHALSAGWGLRLAAAAALLDASPFLTRLELGLGAEVTDGLLERLALRCPHLQELSLKLAAVGTQGVAAVLAGCRRLRALRLEHCAGALDGAALAAAAVGTGGRWALEDLQLVGGGALQITDGDLAALLQLGAGKAVAPALAPRAAPLHTLALCNVRGLTDAALARLEAAAAAGAVRLRHLRLEDCFVGGGGSSSGAGEAAAAPTAPRRPSFSERALLRLLARSPALLSLRVRHAAAPLSAAFVGAAAGACPLLRRLLLDQCDLSDGGFSLAPDPYGALEAVQVVRCAAVDGDGRVAALGGGSADSGHRHHHHHHHRHGHHRHHDRDHHNEEQQLLYGEAAATAAAAAAAEEQPGPPHAAQEQQHQRQHQRRVSAVLLTHLVREGRTVSTPLLRR